MPCARQLCPDIRFELVVDDASESSGGADAELEAALACALEALRDETPGSIRWSFSESHGAIGDTGALQLYGDGTAVRRSSGFRDHCWDLTADIVRVELNDADYFEACLAEPDVAARLACVRFGYGETTNVCQEAEANC
jgi:hypothetical protein